MGGKSVKVKFYMQWLVHCTWELRVSGLRVRHATRVFWGVLGTSIAMSARTSEKKVGVISKSIPLSVGFTIFYISLASCSATLKVPALVTDTFCVSWGSPLMGLSPLTWFSIVCSFSFVVLPITLMADDVLPWRHPHTLIFYFNSQFISASYLFNSW